MSDSPEALEKSDIQGLVVRGFGALPCAQFLLLAVEDPARARGYLERLARRVNRVARSPRRSAIQVAFTAGGLVRLGVPARALATFSREFLEGMDDDVRAESLGDRGANDPTGWRWGRRLASDGACIPDHGVHVLVMLYASERVFEARLRGERARILDAGLRIVHEKDTAMLAGEKEHFGWRDGLSQPKFAGVRPSSRAAGAPGGPVSSERPVLDDDDDDDNDDNDDDDDDDNTDADAAPTPKRKQERWTTPLAPGEFVLGYRNEYEAFSESPTAELDDDPTDVLPRTVDGTRKDLGRNGTYLVYRELTQDVHAFWKYLAEHTREAGPDLAARAIALGTKMVGRWPGGAPLRTSPDRDDPARARDNTFTYDADYHGVECPVGAHIRRANPRDVISEDRHGKGIVPMVRKHQMIRRGRAFGPPVDRDMDARALFAARETPDHVRRGLHFICLVGHINRQFELVQRTWIQSANFCGLFRDSDPLSAARRSAPPNQNDEFTVPAVPVRRKYKALPQFTTLVGGAYFFLPGIRALRFIARGS